MPQPPDAGTAIGAIAADGVVLAADRRATTGSLVAGEVRKIERVHPAAAVAAPAVTGDVRSLLRELRAEARRYEDRHGRPMSVRALATRAADRLREGSLATSLVVGGVNGEGPELYEIDPSGGVAGVDAVAAGSGRGPATAVLDTEHEPGADLGETVRVALDALESALARDPASGGVTLARITAAGVEIEDADSTGELRERR